MTESRLASLMRLTADRMKLDAQTVREAFTHHGIVGYENEEAVAKFLRSRLPTSLGVTTGQVIDVAGDHSRQVDVIVYDALRTPMLFEGSGGTHLVPAEGVVAVVEVKSHLRSGDIATSIENCRSVKQRQRVAYLPQTIEISQAAYGASWTEPPPLYSIFSAVSDNLYAGALNDAQLEVPLHERVDLVCSLDRGVSLNVGFESDASGTPQPFYSARSVPHGAMGDARTDNALLVWYTLFSSVVLQANVRPSNVAEYVKDELRVESEMPGGEAAIRVRDHVLDLVGDRFGIDPGTLRRFTFERESMTDRDLYNLHRSEHVKPGNYDEMTDLQKQQVETAHQLAQTLSFEEWMQLVESARATATDENGPGTSAPETS